MTTFGDLFEPEPAQWALRGDPVLWRFMRSAFRDEPLPSSADEVRSLMERVFAEKVGTSMHDPVEWVHVPALSTTGMSSGGVVPEYWVQTAVPRIIRRWAKATGFDSP